MVKSVTRILLIVAALFSAASMADGERHNAVIEGSKAASMDACVAPGSTAEPFQPAARAAAGDAPLRQEADSVVDKRDTCALSASLGVTQSANEEVKW